MISLTGTANTILVGERDFESSNHGNHDASNWVGNPHTASDTHYNNVTIFDFGLDGSGARVMKINADGNNGNASSQKGVDLDAQPGDSWSSSHPGGAQFALSDGSVTFITETIDDQVLANLCSRNDGNPVGKYDN